MAKRFLSLELIVSVAFQMIDEMGTDMFSVRKLATKLGVQVSSLYNYIDNERDLLFKVAKFSACKYADYLKEQISNLPFEDAVYKGSDAFREFVKEHRHIYNLLLDSRWVGEPEFQKAIDIFTEPIFNYIKQCGLKDKNEIENIYVVVRTITHGFVSLELLKAFDELNIDITESYHQMISSVLDMMKEIIKKS